MTKGSFPSPDALRVRPDLSGQLKGTMPLCFLEPRNFVIRDESGRRGAWPCGPTPDAKPVCAGFVCMGWCRFSGTRPGGSAPTEGGLVAEIQSGNLLVARQQVAKDSVRL